MTKQFALVLLTSAFIATPAFASESRGDAVAAQAFIKEMQEQNASYIKSSKADFFKTLAKGQQPRATVVTCADSRVHTDILDNTPEGDLFMVRNIGNQLATAEGSVEYGVNHLGSSLLLFIGHSSCGAIKAASGDYSGLETAIQRELDTIAIEKEGELIEGIKANVHNQVAAAMEKFSGKVESGKLLIVGAVYDFSDEMKQGAGKLHMINMNGETDPDKLKTFKVAKATKPEAEAKKPEVKKQEAEEHQHKH